MTEMQANGRYNLVAQIFHWVVALLIVGLFATQMLREATPDNDPTRMVYLGMHTSMGMLLFLITLARIAWARLNPPPAPIPAPAWSMLAARIAHVALNLATLFIPIFGYLRVASKGFAPLFFGIPIPSIVGESPWLHELMEALHGEGMAIFLLTLLGLHIGAAIWHQYVRRDGALERMLPWARH